ncbi:MAG: heavy-metal-associated domain-containing protein [Bacteroidales bacterium]|jgi:copper chaperone CopZ|nr:heavy-metal-associated domain-containing protein [Bacteroidales bacterium]
MKNNIKLALLLLFLLGPLSIEAQSKSKDLATVKFDTSIDCEACVNTIMKNIPFEKGVKDVKCDLTTKEVTIEYQASKTRPELLKRALEKLGYTAKVAKAKS